MPFSAQLGSANAYLGNVVLASDGAILESVVDTLAFGQSATSLLIHETFTPVPRPLSTLAKANLYLLKRIYGGPIDIYKLHSTFTDTKTGRKTVLKSVCHIRRAPVMPAGLARKAIRGISLISSNKQLVEGGTYDVRSRDFIVDRSDCPELRDLSADDWIVFGGKKYQIQAVQDYEFDAAWIVTARAIEEEVPERIVAAHVTSLLLVGDAASGSKS